MKPTKLLLLLVSLSMCVAGCAKPANSSSPSEEPSSVTPSSSERPSSESEPVHSSSSSQEPEPASSEEPEVPTVPDDPGNPLTPPDGGAGFPRTAVDEFLAEHEMTEYIVPTIANDQAWSYKKYETLPVMKLWTSEDVANPTLEEQYYVMMCDVDMGPDSSHYDTVGYGVYRNSEPLILFQTIEIEDENPDTQEGYFVIYLAAPEIDIAPTEDGCFPLFMLSEYFDIMNIANTPSFVLPPVETGWEYQLHFYPEVGYWKLFLRVSDPHSPDGEDYNHDAIEDLYIPLLEDDGWEIDTSLYDSYGYYARKKWAEIQFFSWEGVFKFWIYKQ